MLLWDKVGLMNSKMFQVLSRVSGECLYKFYILYRVALYGTAVVMLMGGRAEGLACADPGARTPIGVSGNFS